MPLVTRNTEQGNVYRTDTEPPNWLNGDIWVDTDDSTMYVNNGGTAEVVGTNTARLMALG